MNGVMNKNQLTIVKEYKFDNPIVTEIDSLLHKCFRDCHNNYFHKFKFECIFDIKLINATNREIIYLTISGISMDLYDLIKKLGVARQNCFVYDQITKLTIKFRSLFRYINISYYQKSKIPMCHRHFLK